MNEVWKPVPGWPYEASNLGRVRNPKTGRVLKQSAHKSGYLNVQLWNKMAFKTFLAHRLIAITFLGESPSPEHEVAHSDGDRHNNASSNLRWVLHVQNMRDRDAHGTTARGRTNGKLKHADSAVLKVRQLYDGGMPIKEISATTGIPLATTEGFAKRTRRPVLTGTYTGTDN